LEGGEKRGFLCVGKKSPAEEGGVCGGAEFDHVRKGALGHPKALTWPMEKRDYFKHTVKEWVLLGQGSALGVGRSWQGLEGDPEKPGEQVTP